MINRDTLARAIANGTGDRLIASRSLAPVVGQVRIVRECVAAARAAGLELPATIDVQWRDGPTDVCNGCVRFHRASGRINVYLNANQAPHVLRETTYHELQHVADFQSGEWDSFTAVEREERAIGFANAMLRRFR